MKQDDFIRILSDRGFIHQCTALEGLQHRMSLERIRGYIGFDCTADSLHVGSLVQIMLLRWLQHTGHQPIILIGEGTSRIGDPSGKDESRKLLSKEHIAYNKEGILKVLKQFLSFTHSQTEALLVNNATWLDHLEYIPFLRDIGRHFTLNRMLTFESIKRRLDRAQSITFLEFNYMLLQAYDFLELYRCYGCCLQMGGSDQWGNIVSGVELIRRLESQEVYGLTTPLLTTASGTKMGKTEKGTVWLDSDRCLPYDYWQFWRNVEDADVGRFLRLFTELPLERIQQLEQGNINEAKKILASEATRLCHGQQEADRVSETAHLVFGQGVTANGLPTFQVERVEFEKGMLLIDLFCLAQLAHSKSEARRLVRGKGAKVNGMTLSDEHAVFHTQDIPETNAFHLTAGKKRHALIKVY